MAKVFLDRRQLPPCGTKPDGSCRQIWHNRTSGRGAGPPPAAIASTRSMVEAIEPGGIGGAQ
ncbi:MAG: hypothetical protein ACLQU5_36965 [Isosphaeraceae bacterium]